LNAHSNRDSHFSRPPFFQRCFLLFFILLFYIKPKVSFLLIDFIADVSTEKGVVNRLEVKEKKTKKKRIIALSKKNSRLIEHYLKEERPTACLEKPLFSSQKEQAKQQINQSKKEHAAASPLIDPELKNFLSMIG
jgi:hypothetical protein